MADTRLDVPVVTIDGRPLPPDLHAGLRELKVEESIMLPDRFSLHFDDPHFELFDKATFQIGAKVEVGMQVSGEPVVMTVGEVVALAVELGRTGRHELVVSGYDLTHRLARTSRRRTFQSMSDADIVTQIAGEYALNSMISLPSGGVQNDYILQANETDLAFLQRLAARNGADVWVHEDTLHVASRRNGASGGPITLHWGRELTRFDVRMSAAQMYDEVVVRGWDAQRKESIVAQSTALRPPGRTAQELAAQSQAAFGSTSRTSTWLEVPHAGVASTLAESLHARALAETVVLRGEATGNPWLGAGTVVRLEGVGERLADDYRVTNVTHLYGPGAPFRTRFVCGGLEPHGLADLVAGTPASTAVRAGPGWLLVGEVTDTADPEGLGRVRVRLPSLDDNAESNWARVALPGAGPNTGLAWVPEINDEVLVAFELGDTTRPIVLGGLWSQTNPPPDSIVTNGQETQRRGMVTTGKHEFVLDDADAEIRLIVGGSPATLKLSGSGSTLHGDRELLIKAGTIKVEAEQALKLSGGRVEITAKGDVTVSGKPIKLN